MTFKSRRKHLTTVLLASTTIAAINIGIGQAEDERALRLAKRRSRSEINLPVPTSTPLAPVKQQEAPPLTVKINTEPPTEERLFQLRTTKQFLRDKEKENRDGGVALFITPGPRDDFNSNDANRIGPLWTERGVIATGLVDRQRAGDAMFVQDGSGQFPRGDITGPAAAVMNEYIPSTDMMVSLDVNLGDETNEFGVLVRGKSPAIEAPPNAADGSTVTFYQSGEFYAVTFTTTKVSLTRMEKGKATLINSAALPPKSIFRITVLALGPNFRVFRDGEQVLVGEDGTFDGHYTGVVGTSPGKSRVKFDRFEAKSYAGDFQPRAYYASTKYFHGANVHHLPLYFEQRALERYGHHFGNLVHPFVAHGLFFADFAFWPISIGRTHPWECVCSDLWARPGDLVPFHLTRPVVEAKGVGLELGLIASILLIAP